LKKKTEQDVGESDGGRREAGEARHADIIRGREVLLESTFLQGGMEGGIGKRVIFALAGGERDGKTRSI